MLMTLCCLCMSACRWALSLPLGLSLPLSLLFYSTVLSGSALLTALQLLYSTALLCIFLLLCTSVCLRAIGLSVAACVGIHRAHSRAYTDT